MSNNVVKLDILPVDTHNINTLGLADISFYPVGVSVVNPSIEITPPSFESITRPFAAKMLTIFNSNQLGITCEDGSQLEELPDGIWKLKYTITPANLYFVEKSFIRTEKIQRDWGEAFLSLELGCSRVGNDRRKRELDDAWSLIQGAIADANECNDIAAMKKYKLAAVMLKNFKSCVWDAV